MNFRDRFLAPRASKSLRQRPRRRTHQPQLERLEDRVQPAAVFRPIDGVGTNLAHPDWGTAGSDYLRKAPAAYADGVSAPAGANRPSARVISNAVADQGDQEVLSDRQLSAMVYAWGQFLDHDLNLTNTADPAQPFNVAVPAGDPEFDPTGTGTQVIPLDRSAYDPTTSTGRGNPRQQVNSITAWLDGSQVYGSDAETANKLRTHVGGRLKTSENGLLPINDSATFPDGTLPMASVPGTTPFAAGDVRANENPELLSLQTLFVREHNRVADEVRRAAPYLNDEAIYQRARAWVIGELQVITYKEWLPALLGPGAVRPYAGYNAAVNPGIANEFATAAFRFGHSMVGDDVEFLGNNGEEVADGVPLSEAFFNPDLVSEHNIDPILKYLASDLSSEVDTKVVDSVRNFLFGPPGAGGMDLASLNIQRGRDHGLADYNTMRAAYGLPRVTGFDQITRDRGLQDKLRQLYGTVNNVDAWVGALAEDHVPGSSTGPLIRRVLADQFTRLRDGDRFWYQRTYSGPGLERLEQTTLADVIRRNSHLTNVQGDVFFFKVGISGRVFGDLNRDGRPDPGEVGLGGRTVELVNVDSGQVVATSRTDPNGVYRFDPNHDLELGRFLVRVAARPGEVQTTTGLPDIVLTRGDQFRVVDLGVAPLAPPPGGQTTQAPATNTSTDQTDPTVDPLVVDLLFTGLGSRHDGSGG